MINPTHGDIGRKVVYRDPHKDTPEEGELSSLGMTEGAVFVRFKGPTGELTPCNRLEWVSP